MSIWQSKYDPKLIPVIFFMFLFLWLSTPVSADINYVEEPETLQASKYSGDVNLFYSVLCPICHEEIGFLEQLEEKYPELTFNFFEVKKTKNELNRQLLKNFAEAYESSAEGVPRTFIADYGFVGFEDLEGELTYSDAHQAYLGYKNQIERAVQVLATNLGLTVEEPISLGPEPTERAPWTLLWIGVIPLLYAASFIALRKRLPKSTQARRYWSAGLVAVLLIAVFVLMIRMPKELIVAMAAKVPFPLFVSAVAFVDGFNPCAFTVLFILLSLLTYTRSRRQMHLIGASFIFTSGIVYLVFILLLILLGVVFIDRFGNVVLRVLGAAVIIAGAINLKDFFFYGRRLSLSISDKQKLRIAAKGRQIVQALRFHDSRLGLVAALGATMLLAVSVNLVEFGCTAILPAIYMSMLLTRYGIEIGLAHILWTLLYALIYVLPLYVVLLNFMYVFKSGRITDSQGKTMKLIGGFCMLVFGLVLLVEPAFLSIG